MDTSIKVYSAQGNNETLLFETAINSPYLEETYSFAVPNEAGENMLSVEFNSSNGFAEYVGMLIVQ